MREIPEDIEKVAREVVNDYPIIVRQVVTDIARAILAEREACAKIAEQSPQQTAGDRRRAEFIASAIRSPERAAA